MDKVIYYQAKKEAKALRHLIDFPTTGDGVHQRAMQFTNEVAKLKLWEGNDGYVHKLFQDAAANCGRPVHEYEIQRLLDGSRQYYQNNPNSKRKPKIDIFPDFDESLINQLKEIKEGELLDQSPVKGLRCLSPFWFIERLLPSDQYICIGSNKSYKGKQGEIIPFQKFQTRKLNAFDEKWMSDQELIVPNYMIKRRGLLSASKYKKRDQLTEKDYSEHTLDNTGRRVYLILENDKVDKRKQERILYHFSKKIPLVCIVDSGGKSLHGWFNCVGESEDQVIKILKEACRHGADKQMRFRSQFCRLPNGVRNNGNQQTVLYFNPENTAK